MLGGMPKAFPETELSMDDISYSVVSPVKKCILDIPALPQRMTYKPLAQYFSDHLMACYMDYWVYRQHLSKDYQCWTFNLDNPSTQSKSVHPPPEKLWYSTSVAKDNKFIIIGGSANYSDYMGEMNGTDLVQEYDITTGIWSFGVPLPFPLFEGCAVNTDSGIVVLGDFEGGAFNAYTLVDNMWHPLPRSIYYHTSPACAQVSVKNENVLIALSGQNLEYFSFVENKWIKMKPPGVIRSKYKTPTVGMSFGNLVISGGVDMENIEVSDKIESWDETVSAWNTVPERKYSGRNDHSDISLPSSYLSCEI